MVKRPLSGPLGGLLVCLCLFAAPAMAATQCTNWGELKEALEGGESAKLKGNLTAEPGAVVVSGDATLDLNGKTITCPDDRLTSTLFVVGKSTSLTVNDSVGTGSVKGPSGTITVDGGVFAVTNGELVINGGSFAGFTVAANGGVLSADKATLTFAGGAFTGCSAGAAGGVVYAKTGEITVERGLFAGNSAGESGTADFYLDNMDKGSAGGVSGGVFGAWPSAFDGLIDAGFAKTAVGAVSVVGKNVFLKDGKIRLGTFTFDPSAAPYDGYVSLAPGSVSAPSGDYWVVTDGTVACASWGELKTALESGLSASLSKDISMTSAGGIVPANGELELDLNGKKVSRPAGIGGNNPMFTLSGGAKLTLVDSVGGGEIIGPDSKLNVTGGVFRVSANGALTVEGGTFRDFKTYLSGGVIGVDGGGSVTIRGGTFEDCSADKCGGVINAAGGSSVLTVEGGTFRRNHGGTRTESLTDGGGGAICVSAATATVGAGCFAGNTSVEDSLADIYAVYDAQVTLSGGVFDRSADLSAFTFAAGCRRGLAGGSCVVGKGVLSNGDYIREGTFGFDLAHAPYADLNLIDPAVSTVTKVGEAWRVTSSVDDGVASCWTWNELVEAIESGDDVSLVTNVTVGGEFNVTLDAAQRVTLDLMGHTLERTGSDVGAPVVIMSNASLTVLDTVGGGQVAGAASGTSKNSMFTLVGGALKFDGCRLVGHRANAAGALVSATGGELTISDCVIADCAAVNANGGALYLDGARLTMTSGEVWRCSSDLDGGAIAAENGSKVTIRDASFGDCTSEQHGGAVYANGCSSLSFGGAVCSGNGANMFGDVLYVDNGSATVSGGLFEGNVASGEIGLGCGGGGGIRIQGGVFADWKATPGVSADADFTVKRAGSYYVAGKDLALESGLVRSGLFTFDPKGPTYSGCDFLRSDAQVEKDGEMWRVRDNYTPCSTWSEVKDALEKGKDVILTDDVDAWYYVYDHLYMKGVSASLDLAGHVLKIQAETYPYASFQWRIYKGGSLTISSSVPGGAIDGLESEYVCDKNYPGVFCLTDGSSLTIDGGIIRNFRTKPADDDMYGHAVICAEDGSAVTINGGGITNCIARPKQDELHRDAGYLGGNAISLKSGTFVMTGGLIADCGEKGTGDYRLGGAVYAESSTVKLTGGSIRRCAADYGGAMYLRACSSVDIKDFDYRDNAVTKDGGAVYNYNCSNLKIRTCFAAGNVSGGTVDNFRSNDSSHYKFILNGGEIEKTDRDTNYLKYETGFQSYDFDKYRLIGKDVKMSGSSIAEGTLAFNPFALPYSETSLCDPGLSYAEQDPDSLLWTVKTYASKPVQQITQGGTRPGTVLGSGIYEVNENVTLAGNNASDGMSAGTGLEIAAGATVAIYIKKGCTLTVSGGNAYHQYASAPGIKLPEGSELIFVGEGTLKAKGGNNGAAGSGEKGGDAGYESCSGYDTLIAGKGGDGGNGAAGASPAIGGVGGRGGDGGEGGAEQTSNARRPEKDGDDGDDGGDGKDGSSAGVVNFLGNVTVMVEGGLCVCSTEGNGGGCGKNREQEYSWGRALNIVAGYGGGGGGGGGSEEDAPAIGGGIAGGGGGGGGGSGGMDGIESGQSREPPQGGGGTGGTKGGEDGDGEVTWSKEGNEVGGDGGTGGVIGKNGAGNDIYISETAVLDGASQTALRETHDYLKRRLVFDYTGGHSRGASQSVRDVYLYMDLPDAPMPDKDSGGTGTGWLFAGYYTQKDGLGTKCYDGTGEACLERWTIDCPTTTLYACWREVTPPADPLVVTRLDDAAFDPDSDKITFRAALTWAMLFPDLLGKDGTPSKITFASSLFADANEVTVRLTEGQIRVSEARFVDHPMVIAGPTEAERRVTVDASLMSGRILDIGIDNRLDVQGVNFTGGSADTSGGAINMKGGVLAIAGCAFAGNSAATGGGAVYLGADGALGGVGTMTNVVFTSNTAGADGGAVSCHGQFKITCCRFESNKAEKDGGAIFGQTNSQVNVEIATFRANSAKKNGGAWASGGGIFALNCTVLENQATENGGGYMLLEGAGSGTLKNQFVNCTFRQNSARKGGGICAVKEGALSMVNVLAMHNSASGGSDGYDDIYVDSSCAEITANGLLAKGTNLSGCGKPTLRVDQVFSSVKPGQDTLTIGGCVQNVERLASREDNPALEGYNASPYRTDMTGRPFDACQIGAWWLLVEKPSLVVTTLADGENPQDGLTSLREVMAGIAGGTVEWTALMSDGAYKVTFKAGLAGDYILSLPHFDINVPNGVPVEIDGGAAEGGALTFVGNDLTNSAFRAFFVRPGNTLRLKNLRFSGCLGRNGVGAHETQTHDGGAIVNTGRLSVEDCAFEDCSAGDAFANPIGYGGAIVNGLLNASGATLAVTNVVFERCRAAQGGAIYNWNGNTADIFGAGFTSNVVGNGTAVMVATGGAIYNGLEATLSYAGTTFTDNTAIVDGKTESSNVGGKDVSQPHYTVSVKKGTMSVALNAMAAPEISGADAAVDLTTSSDEVSLKPGNVKPLLYYGLGHSDTPGGEYKVESWVQADAQGRLPAALTAPKSGSCGYYRVFVRD